MSQDCRVARTDLVALRERWYAIGRMRTIERFPRVAVALFAGVLAVLPGCSEKKDSAIPKDRGVFYRPETG